MNTRRFLLIVEAAVGLILAVYLVWPALVMLVTSLETESGWGIGRYVAFIGSPACRRALWGSVWVSLSTVAACMVVGVPLAVLIHRVDFPGRSFLAPILILPLALPPLVGTLVFYYLFSETGIIPRVLEELTGAYASEFAARNYWGVLLVHTYTMYPFVYILVLASLQRLDDSLLEAARSLGAGRGRIWLTIWAPLVSPALVGASLLVFMTSMASFSAPYFFDDSGLYLSVLIYYTKRNVDLPMAMTQSVVLSMVSILFLILLQRYRGVEHLRGASKGVSRPPRPVRPGWPRFFAMAGVAVGAAVLLLPNATILLMSFVKSNTWTVEIFPSVFTVENYTAVLRDPDTWRPVTNSLIMALSVTALVGVLGLATGACLARRDLPFRKSLDLVAMIPWALPGTVLAIQLIVVFRNPTFLGFGHALVGTIWLLPVAYAMRMLPIVVRSSTAAFQHLDPTLTEAAAGLGEKPLGVFRRVVLPLIVPGWVSGLLLVFVTTLGEFASSIMLYVYDNTPISVSIDQQRVDVGSIFVYGMILVALAVLAAGASRKLTGGKRAV